VPAANKLPSALTSNEGNVTGGTGIVVDNCFYRLATEGFKYYSLYYQLTICPISQNSCSLIEYSKLLNYPA